MNVVAIEVVAASSLLKKYISLVCYHVTEVLNVATTILTASQKCFKTFAGILASDISGNVQFITCDFLCS